MTKSVRPLVKTHIRPIEPKDFAFIQSLANNIPGFTVPSDYILWFFVHFHSDYCRVLETEAGDLRAYILSMPTSAPRNGIAIWQVGAATSDRTFALEYFAAYLRDLTERTGVAILCFTAQNNSKSMRLIRQLAKRFGGCEVVQLNPVPTAQGEHEFRLLLEKGAL